ncbi:PREDICTED: uncharacterized protein LOC106806115 [Priapulus caudatus]|uniref:Uncharacterized protein LOC106806115 n=1 Tax=Priapulus caudatus TaxID=37621 RepID=A0ABM1DU34_PRICU|nr:PREDICTED: uncharacterized protein LOC106806115 [Priapulus caudatus]
MFGREPKLFSELALLDDHQYAPMLPTSEPDTKTITNRIEDMESCFVKVKANIHTAQDKQKKQYHIRQSKGFKAFIFKIGDYVLKKNYRKIGRKGSRLENEWVGPYEINNIYQGCATLKEDNGVLLKKKVSLVHLKPYRGTSCRDQDACHPSALDDIVTCNGLDMLADIALRTHDYNLPKQQNLHDDSGDSIEVVSVITSGSKPTFNISNIKLREADFNKISNGHWLDDMHINFASGLLRDNYPSLQGFMSVQKVVQLMSQSMKFIQPLFVNGNHWVVVSNLFTSRSNTVRLYDSLPGLNPYSNLLLQVASLLKTEHSNVVIELVEMHRQVGGSDCGVYAIASMVALCNSIEPSTIQWNQQMMRSHLVACFRDRKMEMFPIYRKRRVQKQVRHTWSTPVFCTCRLPDTPGQVMIQCDFCHEKFHGDCVSASNRENLQQYKCDTCSVVYC